MSLFIRMKPRELSALPYASAGVKLYCNAIFANSNLAAQHQKVIATYLCRTNRAVVEPFANPAASIAPTGVCKPTADKKVAMDRWNVTDQYLITLNTQSNVDDVNDDYRPQKKPSTDTLFNLSMLPPKAEHVVNV